jgi:hypothetical protein
MNREERRKIKNKSILIEEQIKNSVEQALQDYSIAICIFLKENEKWGKEKLKKTIYKTMNILNNLKVEDKKNIINYIYKTKEKKIKIKQQLEEKFKKPNITLQAVKILKEFALNNVGKILIIKNLLKENNICYKGGSRALQIAIQQLEKETDITFEKNGKYYIVKKIKDVNKQKTKTKERKSKYRSNPTIYEKLYQDKFDNYEIPFEIKKRSV